jgi:hypothetical protein
VVDAADVDNLHDTYEEWVQDATRRLQELRDLGFTVEKVHVEMAELARWCLQRGLPLDGSSRAQFASDKMRHLGEEPGAGGGEESA